MPEDSDLKKSTLLMAFGPKPDEAEDELDEVTDETEEAESEEGSDEDIDLALDTAADPVERREAFRRAVKACMGY